MICAEYVVGEIDCGNEVPQFRSSARSAARRSLDIVYQGCERSAAIRGVGELLDNQRGHADPDTVWCGLLALVYAGSLDTAETYRETFARELCGMGSDRGREVIALARAHTDLLRGTAVRASNILETAVGRASSRSVLLLSVAWLIEAHVALGAVDRAQRVLVDHGLTGALDVDEPDRPHVLAARGALHLAAGRFRQGLEDYRACGRLLIALKIGNPAVVPWRSRAVFGALAVGRVDLAAALAEDELIAARRWGSPRAVGCALHALALARRDDDSVALLENAARLLNAAQARSEQVRVLHDLSVMHASRRRPEAARSSLDAATEVSRLIDNPFWSKRLEAVRGRLEASDTGVRLTDQEIKIARLACAGETNKRIAETLFLAVRTVEFHLTSVYRKLDVPGRRGLVATLAETGAQESLVS